MEISNDINNLNLDQIELYKILSKKINCSNYDKLSERIAKTYSLTICLIKDLLEGKLSGYENDDTLGNINPLHWEFGHIINFWINNCIKLLNYPLPNKLKKEYLFDSFRTDRETRFEIVKEKKIESINELNKIYESIITNTIIKIVQGKQTENKLDPITSYLINLVLLHNDMHNESFCFSLQLLACSKPKLNDYFKIIDHKCYDVTNEYIFVKGGVFKQGWNDKIDNFTFDNERPEFHSEVKDFKVSKYCVTQGQYLDFINNDGYSKEEYWCPEGWRWKIKNKISLPQYWEFKNGKFFQRKWDNWIEIQNSLPITHISWYEANAYCRWAKCRLPTEAEWEYLSTNKGLTKYPWGDYPPNSNLANLNYKYDGIQSVDSYNSGINKLGVQQLIGNIWEWCQEPIYPYNGFEIDPVYREMSYPFFGFKRICRGGAWCVPDYLINSKYRNAQKPECRMQYIGFRTCI